MNTENSHAGTGRTHKSHIIFILEPICQIECVLTSDGEDLTDVDSEETKAACANKT